MRARLTILAALLVLLLPPGIVAQSGGERPANMPAKVLVRSVRFRGTTHVAPATLEKIAARYQGKPIYDPDWLRELGDRVRDAEQQQGYFRCRVDSDQQLVVGKDKRQYAIATVNIHEGEQYRLKELSVVNAKAFPAEELVAVFPLRPGDIFNTASIRKGLENLRKTYGTKGYINFVAVPDTQIDEAARTIRLVIDLDEGAAYHVGKVQVLGLTAARTQRLLSDFPLKPGDAFDSRYVEAFYRENRSLLPLGAKPEVNTLLQQNNDEHIVDIVFDFRPWCDKISIGCHPWSSGARK